MHKTKKILTSFCLDKFDVELSINDESLFDDLVSTVILCIGFESCFTIEFDKSTLTGLPSFGGILFPSFIFSTSKIELNEYILYKYGNVHH